MTEYANQLPDFGMPAIAQQIWDEKYRFKRPDGTAEYTVVDTWNRVAVALADAEKQEERIPWASRFYDALADFKFLPAGRIIAGAGTERNVTLFNCYVLGTIGDDMGSIFANVREAALTLQQGGGIGHDFSTIRPKGAPVLGVGADASGPLSFMDVWDSMCRTIMSAGARRGAMMGTLRCDHPDIEAFIEAKRDPKRLRMFNVSVLVTDAFMKAVENDWMWDLHFNGKTYKTVVARELFDAITRGAYDCAEPGVIFIDRVNAQNNLAYCETISATNPCGEEPLPPYGACLLGSINLAAMVRNPFSANAGILKAELEELTRTAVRMLDNVVDVSRYPLKQQEIEAKAKRRLGLGVTGLADALIMCGLHYGSEEGRAQAARWMKSITNYAYLASAELAKEKGRFELYDISKYAGRPFIQSLDQHVFQEIYKHGLRNSHLTSIAPTGTISLFAGNVSSGIEPVFAAEYTRKVLQPDGSKRTETVKDYAVRLYETQHPGGLYPLNFVTAHDLTPQQHLLMQAALQPHIDSAISKTVNCPADMSFEDFQDLYREAYRLGLKGCTAYRPNDITGSVLSLEAAPAVTSHPTVPLPPAKALTEREPMLAGFTYKLKWPPSEHAIYVTINDAIMDGERRPFEVFINSKNLEHYAWTVALTRMVSAIFRRGGDVAFVAEELKAVFDPRGGAWMDGGYVPSLLAAIGGVIERHMSGLGEPVQQVAAAEPPPVADSLPIPQTFCSRCSSANVIKQSGCNVCRDCGNSACG